MMNAGSSDVGQAFARAQLRRVFRRHRRARACRLPATPPRWPRSRPPRKSIGREIEVFTVGQVICRPTQKEAEDYYQHVNIDNADWGAIDCMLANKHMTPQTMPPEEYDAKRRYFAARSIGGYPFVGTPDRVAEELAIVSQAGVRGIGLSFVNYLNEVPYFCDEVLPRLSAPACGRSSETQHCHATLAHSVFSRVTRAFERALQQRPVKLRPRNEHANSSAAHRAAALGHRARQARPVAAVRQYARHAVLPRLRLGAILQGRIRAPLRSAAGENARAQARRRHRAGRAEPLEFRRRHAVADRPLGMARAGELRAGAARWRADHDLFDGRHARRSGAPAGRSRGEGRAPQPQRPLRRCHGRAAARTKARARPHRTDGDRSAARRLPAGQSI